MKPSSSGFTLIEVLIALAILGVLGLVFVRVFVSTMDATSHINARNDLLHEAQIAEQIIASKVKLAWYVYPPGTTLTLNNGATTRNALAGSQEWRVGSDPILALVLPPEQPEADCTSDPQGCYVFYAYYAFPRAHYVASIGPTSAQRLDPDPRNDDTWVLMEFRTRLAGFVPNTADTPSCTNTPVPSGGLSGSGRLLVEYVQPETDPPTYTIFTVQPDGNVELGLRMRKKTHRRTIVVPPASDPPLTLKASPRNLRVGCP
jgi:prepilin-type N-terminal cleavage/methylation domain-containing protein